MSLAVGSRLGPYEILAPLGAGGMGEVYRARDSKLKRDEAIKVLPQSLAADADALARFEREALAVAALSHPNILAIFDFGTQDGIAYAVMELLESQTLRAKFYAGPIPQKQAVGYAFQVAKGLSAAHEKGIVHRDLKPENLFVSKDGHVKILDFGLAKKVKTAAPGEETSVPSVSGLTEPGTVMGTLGYMPPEQVKGLAVDHRTDIFSFGAILYEMLSGKRPFSRPTSSETIAAILKEEPPELSESGLSISPGRSTTSSSIASRRTGTIGSKRPKTSRSTSPSSPRRRSRAVLSSPRHRLERRRSSSPLRPSSFSPSRGPSSCDGRTRAEARPQG